MYYNALHGIGNWYTLCQSVSLWRLWIMITEVDAHLYIKIGSVCVHHTSTPVYLSRHIQPLIVTRRLRPSATPQVCKPTTRTNFADRAFRCSAPAVWNSLTADIVDSCSVTTFKRKLKTILFRHAFSSSQRSLSSSASEVFDIMALYKSHYYYYYSVCVTVSASINPLPSNRLRCCDRYIPYIRYSQPATDCDGPGRVGLWTLTRMYSIIQTDATSHNHAKRDCGLSKIITQRITLGSWLTTTTSQRIYV